MLGLLLTGRASMRRVVLCWLASGGLATPTLAVPDGAKQADDPIEARTRLDYYMNEAEAEVLVPLPGSLARTAWTVRIGGAREALVRDARSDGETPLRLSIPMTDLPFGAHRLRLELLGEDGSRRHETDFELVRRPAKPNAVQIDRLTGGLRVDGLPFLPFGFYTYSPVQPTLAEEELVKGFNMMSPYQRIEAATRSERRRYMDRCAELGMKVNYNLLSVAGGGGVGGGLRDGESRAAQLALLREEVLAFRDHPALLAWYISDEPVGQGIPVEVVQEAYDLVHELDPYHPVSVVFMTPSRAHEYAGAMDIVMADPYPIPNNPITEVIEMTEGLHEEFVWEKPVWIVPQAFGGGEWWAREPTKQEIRAMTYLALVYGATGIQYFVRSGMNSFPKSTTTWNEAGAMAREVAELTPDLLSERRPAAATSPTPGVEIAAWASENRLTILAVNTRNQPARLTVRVGDATSDGPVEVLFENRFDTLRSGAIQDWIDGYGTRVYRIGTGRPADEAPAEVAGNLALNASFEDNPSVGTPAGCYVGVRGDRGASYFVDPRDAVHGQHSLRVTTPTEDQGVSLGFFPAYLKPGNTYVVSLWARAADPALLPRKRDERRWPARMLRPRKPAYDRPTARLAFGNLAEQTIELATTWTEYRMTVRVPPELPDPQRAGVSLSLLSRGTAWFDLMQVVADPQIEPRVLPAQAGLEINLRTRQDGTQLVYTTDETEPSTASTPFAGPFVLQDAARLRAAAVRAGKVVGRASELLLRHRGLGASVRYGSQPHRRYAAVGDATLVDGLTGSTFYRDGRWQGFLETDADVVIDLGEGVRVSTVSARFLQSPGARIFLPEWVEAAVSVDGVNFEPAKRVVTEWNEDKQRMLIETVRLPFEEREARYVRLFARSQRTVPDWHRYRGTPAWTFTDEIEVR